MPEDRYEAIELIVKTRADGAAWFDTLSDYLTEGCEESGDSCTCGLQHMGGCTGTIEQCWKFLGIDDEKVLVEKSDLLVVLAACDARKCPDAHRRLFNECNWWEDWLARSKGDDDDDGEEDK